MTVVERRHVVRRTLVATLLFGALTGSAVAQVSGIVRGTVVDQTGAAVADATVSIDAQDDSPRRLRTTTNDEGEYSQIGLPAGSYLVTAEKTGEGKQTFEVRVRIGQTVEVHFQLTAGQTAEGAAEPVPVEGEQGLALTAAFNAGVAAARDGRHDEAVAKFREAIDILPTCHQCYYNIGVEHSAQQQYEAAEAAFRKAAELKPDAVDVYRGLASLYTAQQRFDEAQAASETAARYASDPAGSVSGASSAEAIFNQAIILWNASRIAEAKAKLLEALAFDADHAEAQYWLGMASVNEGDLGEAATRFERYLELAPAGQYAPQAKGILERVKP